MAFRPAGDTWTTWTDSTATGTDIYSNAVVSSGTPTTFTFEYVVTNEVFPPYDWPSSPTSEAVDRARRLLSWNLTAYQQRCLRIDGYFPVKGSDGGLYRIRRGSSHNVRRLERHGRGYREVESLCAYATGMVPTDDTMLAQKLMLESDERAFRRIAVKRAMVSV